MKRWSKRAKVKILELHKVFVPVHVHGNHWCLAVINLEDKRFEYYDSLQVTLFNLLSLPVLIASTALIPFIILPTLMKPSGRAG